MSDKALLMSIAEKLTYLKLSSQTRADPGGKNLEEMWYLTSTKPEVMHCQVYVYKNFLYVDLYTGRTKIDLFTCKDLIKDVDLFILEHVLQSGVFFHNSPV